MSDTCPHPQPDPDLGLPCPVPGCPAGTPKDRVAVMHGATGALRMLSGRRYEVESDGGVVLWERQRVGEGWQWQVVRGR